MPLPPVSCLGVFRLAVLGLAVVRMIVTTLFGGTITCNSVEGKGTKFVIMIPFIVSEVD